MYTGLFHTHKLAITLFILIYLIKTILLIAGRKDSLQNFSGKIKIFEMAISALFLITGVWLLFVTSEIRTLFILKLVLVVVAVPLAFIGFRKENKVLGPLAFLLIVSAYGLAEMNKRTMIKRLELPEAVIIEVSDPSYSLVEHGKALFVNQCVVCNGESGDLQMSGAKNLTTSEISKEEVIQRIKEGKLTMISYEDYFTSTEIEALATYVMSLRKN